MLDKPKKVNQNIILKVKEQKIFNILNWWKAKAARYNFGHNEEQVDLKHDLFWFGYIVEIP